MLINFSNHPSTKWPESQLEAGLAYGKIVDIPFPEVSPNATELEIKELAERCSDEIMSRYDAEAGERYAHVMGEPTLVYAIVQLLKGRGIVCVASTTTRESTEENGVKSSRFTFGQFRKY